MEKSVAAQRELLVYLIKGTDCLAHTTSDFGMFCAGMHAAFCLVQGYLKATGGDMPLHAETESLPVLAQPMLTDATWTAIFDIYKTEKDERYKFELADPLGFYEFRKALLSLQAKWEVRLAKRKERQKNEKVN